MSTGSKDIVSYGILSTPVWSSTEESPMHVASQHLRPDFIKIANFSFWYGNKQALFDISLDIP